MPKIEEPVAKPKPAPKPVPIVKSKEPMLALALPDRNVIYPDYHVRCFFDGEWLAGSDENGDPIRLVGEGPLTAEQAMIMLEWKDEEEYNKEMQELNPDRLGSEGQPVVYKYDGPNEPDSLFTDRGAKPKKVRCNNVVGNRWFDDRYTKGYMQSILKRVWAGPTTFPGETVNGETIVITRTGRIDSGQKRLVALVWATQEWEKDDYWKQWWPEGPPTMDCTIVFGVSEDPRVTRTLDQVQPRSEADQLYTGPAFRDLAKNDKRLVSRIAQTCIDLLWSRTWDGSKENTREPIRTGIAAMGFWDRHPKMQDCVRHVFDVDYKESFLQSLKLPRGLCASAMYLMACSATDRDAYVPTDGVPPDESKIDWQYLDDAKQFMTDIASNEFDCLKSALLALSNPNDPNQTGSVEQKLAVLALAWAKYLEGGTDIDDRRRAVNTSTEEDGTVKWDIEPYSLQPYYVKDGDKFTIKGLPTFGGIDLGKPDPEAAKTLTKTQLEERKKAERTAELEKMVKGSTVTLPIATGLHEIEEQLEAIHQRFPGRVIIFANTPDKDSDGKLMSNTRLAQVLGSDKFGGDAKKVCQILGADAPAKIDKDWGLRVRFPMLKLQGFLLRLAEAGQRVALAEGVEDKLVIKDWVPPTDSNSPVPVVNGQEMAQEEVDKQAGKPARKSPMTISGKPTRAAVEAEQTRKAALADEEKTKEAAKPADKANGKPKSKALPTKPTKKPALRGGIGS